MKDNKKVLNSDASKQDDIYASFNTKKEEAVDNTSLNNSQTYQTQKEHYNNNYLESHTVLTRTSKASKIILYGFYLFVILIGVVVFFMFREDRYSFYLVKDEVSISNGSSYQVELTPKYERYFDYLNYKYEIEDENIATVDEFGTVKAIGAGTTNLKISLSPGITSKKMRVISNMVGIQSINLFVYKNSKLQKGNTVNMNPNQTVTLKAIANNDDKSFVDVKYSSTDETVAIVDEFGNVTAKGEGIATINGIKDSVTSEIVIVVKKKETSTTPVTPKTIQSISFTNNNVYLNKGNSTQLTVTINPKSLLTSNLTWTSSNSKVASVNVNGVVTGVSLGEAEITVKTSNGKTATCTVKVSGEIINVESISLNNTSVTIEVGEKHQLIATINPSNATIRNVTWISSKTNVATVDNGLVIAKGEGTTTITARSSNGKMAIATVKVNKKSSAPTPTVSEKVTKVDIGTNQTTKYVGETLSLSASITPSNAQAKSIKWTSSNTSVATVDQNGQVKAVKKGTAVITVEADGLKDTCTIIVKEKETAVPTVPAGTQVSAKEVTLSKTSLTVSKGSTGTFDIKVSGAAGIINVLSSNSSIVTVTSSNSDCNGSKCFFDAQTGKEQSITYTVKGVGTGTAYINISLDDLVSYDEKEITGSGKIGILVK